MSTQFFATLFTRRSLRFVAVFGVAAALVLSGISVTMFARSAQAATAALSNVSFGAPVHTTYNHATGGGAWNTGSTTYVKGELQGTDYRCGEYATFLAKLDVATSPTNPAPFKVRLSVDFTTDSTGQSGVALFPSVAPEHLLVNSGVIAAPGNGTGVGGSDGGFSPSTLTPPAFVSSTTAPTVVATGAAYTSGSKETLTFTVENLQRATSTVIRMDALIGCKPGSSPTGNLQASLMSINVTSPVAETISGGNQTVNFRGVGNIGGAAGPALSVVKTISADGASCPGTDTRTVTSIPTTIRYCYTVTNSGTGSASNVVLKDDMATNTVSDDTTVPLSVGGAPAASPVTLAAGATATGYMDSTFTTGGIRTNIATVTATGITAVTDTATLTVNAGSVPAMTVVKDQLSSNPGKLGDVIKYSITATNSGNVSLTNVVITDNNATITSCTPTLPLATFVVGASIVCLAEHTVTSSDLTSSQVLNTATATSNEIVAQASNVVTTPIDSTPLLSVTKRQTSINPFVVGDSIDYSIVVKNIGNVTLTNVTIADANATGLSCSPSVPVASLAVGGTITCTASHAVIQADVDAGIYENSAVADSTQTAEVTSNLVTTPIPQNQVLEITKAQTSVDPVAVGDVITYNIFVTNTGNVGVANVVVADADATLGVCSPVSGSTLAPGATMTCPASFTTTSTGNKTNVATVSGTGVATTTSNTVTTPLIASTTNDIEIFKRQTSADPYVAGDVVTYEIVVLNSGNTILSNIAVTDSNATLSPSPCVAASMAAGTTLTCTASHTVTQAEVNAGSFTNTAVVTSDEIPTTNSNTVTTTIPPYAALGITKGQTSFSTSTVGGEIVYSIIVTNTGNVVITDVTTKDPGAVMGTCTPGATNVSLNPGATITCSATHTITAADLAAGFYSNTALVESSSKSITNLSNPVSLLFTTVKVAPTPTTDDSLAHTGNNVALVFMTGASLLLGGSLLLFLFLLRRNEK